MMKRLKELSELVNEGDDAMEEAIYQERAAKAALLGALVLAVRDALPAICSKVPAHASGKASEYGRSVARWMPEDGPYGRAVLVGGSARPSPPASKIEGVEPLVGSGLYLSEDGEFFAVTFDGRYRNSAAASLDDYWWEATPTPLTPRAVIDDRWPVDRVADVIALEMQAQVDGKGKATDKARARAETVTEAARLLAGIR